MDVKMKIVSVLDTAITSFNLGNQIIMESVYDVMEELFPEEFLYSLPWEGPVSRTAHRYLRRSDYVFFGGTNSLSSHMLKYKQMGFRARDLLFFGNLTLLGMGWWQYQNRPDLYTRIFIRRLLSTRNIHSVRDEYTRHKLEDIGIRSVVNTCCPTTWKLTANHCAQIPATKAESVVVTLTDYNRRSESDERLLASLIACYKCVFYWVQGAGDYAYIQSFDEFKGRLRLIAPKLKKYDEILSSTDCDYIGTRLHAGIRAIQKGKRALILAVDNRAEEIARDINLNVKPRSDIAGVVEFLSGEHETKLQVPFGEINRWKAQFV